MPAWQNRAVVNQLAFGAFAVFHLMRPDHTPEVSRLSKLLHPCPLRRIVAKMMALESLFRKLGPDRDSVIRRIVALKTPREGVDDQELDAQWFEHLRASATNAARDGGDEQREVHGTPWTTQVVKGRLTSATNAWWETFRSGVTRPSRGSWAFRPRTGVRCCTNLTDDFDLFCP